MTVRDRFRHKPILVLEIIENNSTLMYTEIIYEYV